MIYGERIRFRHMERTDLPRFVDYLNDPEVNWGLAVYLPLSMAAEEQWFVNMLKRPPAEQPLAIEVRSADPAGGADTWKLVGNCALLDIDWRNRYAEVGIFIGEKRLWNQGLGSEAMSVMLRHAFNTLLISCSVASTSSWSSSSGGVCSTTGTGSGSGSSATGGVTATPGTAPTRTTSWKAVIASGDCCPGLA